MEESFLNNPSKAVFLSYASQDAEAAARLAAGLQAGGIDVWFDRGALRGGDAWDAAIRQQIKACALFIPLISRTTSSRSEGYFRLEWKLGVDRSHLIASNRTFLLPVVVDDVVAEGAVVPDKFLDVQWTVLPGGEASAAFVARVADLLAPAASAAPGAAAATAPRNSAGVPNAVGREDSRRVRAAPSRGRWAWVIAAGVLAVGVVVSLSVNRLMPGRDPAAAPVPSSPPGVTVPRVEAKSIAVLPFVDMSEKKDQEYFSDGLAEELIDHLAHVKDLQVIARTSSFQFKGKNQDMRSIAGQLGVANLLEGSVRKSGARLRVTAQLIRASDGVHLWSQTYDRKLDDVFKVQDEIAGMVAQAMQVSLTLQGAASAASMGTTSSEAHELYLQGRAIDHQSDTIQNENTAIEYLRRALQLDPTYAAAWARLSVDLDSLAEIGTGSGDARLREESRKAALRALELAPDLVDAHAAVARVMLIDTWEFAGGAAHVRRGLELDPHDPLTLSHASALAGMGGDSKKAVEFQERAVRNDPVYWVRYRDYSYRLFDAQRYSESLDAIRRQLDLNPSSDGAHLFAGIVRVAMGDAPGALEEFGRETDLNSRKDCVCEVFAYDMLGRTTEANAALVDFKMRHAADQPYQIGAVYAARNDIDTAFKWFDRAFRQHDGGLTGLILDPLLKANVRSDPRFKALVKKMHFVDPSLLADL